MKRSALLSLPLVALLVALIGCPPKTTTTSQPAGTAPETSAAPTATPPVQCWADQAEKLAKLLDKVVALVEKNDKLAANDAAKDAYYVGYEDPDWHLEAASMTNLPEEPLDGKPRNVKIVREESFAEIRAAVKSGAPAAKVRELCDRLVAQVRADAKKLDDMKVKPK